MFRKVIKKLWKPLLEKTAYNVQRAMVKAPAKFPGSLLRVEVCRVLVKILIKTVRT